MKEVLECHSVSVGYGNKKVLTAIDFGLAAGEVGVLIGANGSGKSTMLRALAGAAAPLEGRIEIEGRDIAAISPKELARTLAVVFTDRNGGGAMTVEECVAMGRHPYTGVFGRLGKDDKEIISQAIGLVGMADKRTRYLATLSDGERQKAMIARALAQQTPLIILDEPTAFLDVAGRLEVTRLLRRLADAGHAVILSTHDIAPAVAIADKLLVIDSQVHTLASGTKEEILASGALDKAFAGSALRFDADKGDYRSIN